VTQVRAEINEQQDERAEWPTGASGGGPRPALPPLRPGADPLGLLPKLIPAYLVLVLVGAGVFKFGPVMAAGHEMSTVRAVFTAINAATLTGFPSTVGLEDFDEEGWLGPVTVLVLMVAGALFSMIAGGVAVVRVLRLPYTPGQVVSAALASLVLAVLAGATCLLSFDRRVFDSVFQAASAFTNSGLYVGRLSGASSLRAQGVLVPLAFVGGLGLPVLMEVFDRVTGATRRLSTHARVVFTTSALLYLAATVALFLILATRRQAAGLTHHTDWRDALAVASATAVNARGAGLPFEFASSFPRSVQWLLIVLMAVGANPAGTGAGVKATSVWQLARGVRDALGGAPVGRAAGIAAVWLAGYAALVFVGLLLLVWRVPDMAADQLLFLAVSATSNVGLAHDPVSIVGPGLYTLCALMLAGRLAPVFVLWWMATTTRDAEVAVG
jgi:Trk-type K+ transport system membrane component